MKYLFIISLILVSLMAIQYKSGKIDMHNGQSNYNTNKGGFSHQSMGMSNFLDNNKTKKSKTVKK